MTDKNEWWLKKFNEKNWGACFECCDYEGMVDDIRGILAEHTRRIVEVLEGIKQEKESLWKFTPGGPVDMFNSWQIFALDEAIKKIKGLDREPS